MNYSIAQSDLRAAELHGGTVRRCLYQFVLIFGLALLPNAALAAGWLYICNKGDMPGNFVTYSPRPVLGGLIEGWFSVQPGGCFSTPSNSWRTTSIGFLGVSRDGIRVPVRFDFGRSSQMRNALRSICVPNSPEPFKYSRSEEQAEGPCLPSEIQVPVSFAIIGGDNDVTVNVHFDRRRIEEMASVSRVPRSTPSAPADVAPAETGKSGDDLIGPNSTLGMIDRYSNELRLALPDHAGLQAGAIRGLHNSLLEKLDLDEAELREQRIVGQTWLAFDRTIVRVAREFGDPSKYSVGAHYQPPSDDDSIGQLYDHITSLDRDETRLVVKYLKIKHSAYE